ncbi:TPA: hypothetical protein ACXDAY_003451 [Clostridium botulinum]|uniref:hypothetical protein n=1 Tax=Clostridium botulinum TaxID=1491 RepID=UPI00035BA040|nr:hypothetical protein [Clostridium botulinum]EPS56783.1 hypothetical protein CLQ_01841 [Clostridium botulinum Af84]MBN3360166.1 hypothetical protein [Clostridium botulinum]NFM82644.1 hypothetical protein [Clostridium botulinum]NFP12270.1 hypothetical protein [Clostridium botulinum]NFR29730.1 hypothetical protein [Clostridium botulinum]
MYIKIIDNLKIYKGMMTNYIYDNLDINKGYFILNQDETLCICEYDGNIDKNKNPNTIEISKDEYNNILNEINTTIKENQKDISQNTDAEKEQLIKTVNNLSVENQKKDFMLKELASTVNTLNLKIQKLEGGSI